MSIEYDPAGTDPDDLIVCPYDPAHRVARKRMQYHLIKCRKNFNPKHFKTCPFKATHIVPTQEFTYHMQTCTFRGVIEKDVMEKQRQDGYQLKGNTDIPVSDWTVPDQTESWDEDNVTYQPPETNHLFTVAPNHRQPERRQERRPQQHQRRLQEVREPPRPRMPDTHGGRGAQVYQYSMLEAKMTQANPSPIGIGRGRGRGRGLVIGRPLRQPANQTTVPPGFGQVGQAQAAPPGFRQVGQARAVPPGFGQVGQARSEEMNVEPEIARQQAMEPRRSLEAEVPDPEPIDQLLALAQTEEEIHKRVRRLKKMLRQIEQLEEKESHGEELNEDQLTKIRRKVDVIAQLHKYQ